MPPKASSSKGKKKREDSECESKPPKKKKAAKEKEPGKKTKTLPGCMVGEVLTACTTNHFVDMPYISGLVLHFEQAVPPFQVDGKAGPASDVKPSRVANTFDFIGQHTNEDKDKEDWFRKLLVDNEPKDSEMTLLGGGAMGDNVAKYVFGEKNSLTIATAEFVSVERIFVKPGIAGRQDGKTREAKQLQLTFEEHDDKSLVFECTKAAYSNPYDSDPPGFEEHIIPVDLKLQKVAVR